MDIEGKIDKIGDKVDNLTSIVEKHIAKDEGLQLPERMGKVETKIKTKVSWVGLSGALTALSGVVALVVMIVKEV